MAQVVESPRALHPAPDVSALRNRGACAGTKTAALAEGYQPHSGLYLGFTVFALTCFPRSGSQAGRDFAFPEPASRIPAHMGRRRWPETRQQVPAAPPERSP